MRKAAIILIIIGVLVVLATNWYLRDIPTEVAPVSRDNTTLRATTSGEVVGFRGRHGARTWLGIPFAAPPTGNDRWRAPQPPATHQGTFEALRSGPPCPQFASLLTGAGDDTSPRAVVGDEDCLYLDIWAPPNAANLPVMLWIHGGGNTAGFGGAYNGAKLATSHDVVVVSTNYRLGVFGWFRHPALATGDQLDDSGNFGTLDLIRALHWIQANIQQFGGNPNNVTLFGESAGGTNALAMMASPLAQGLFHKAIIQSGGLYISDTAAAENFAADGGDDNSSNEILARLLLADGIVPSPEAARTHITNMSRPQIRTYLYDRPATDFFAVFDNNNFGGVDVPTLFADTHVLPDTPTAALFSDTQQHTAVPVILGSNRDEAALFMVSDPDHVQNWLGFLPRLKDEPTYTRLVKYRSLAQKARDVDLLAQYMTGAGNPQVFTYRFDWDESPSQAGFDLSVALGAAHGLEIPFVFNDFDNGLNVSYVYPADEAQFNLARAISGYWAEFAHSGNPGQGRSGTAAAWLPWGNQGKTSIIFDTPTDGGIRMMEDIVDIGDVKAALVADNGFTRPEDQCAAYAQSFFGDEFVTAEYNALNPQCAALDPAELRPWE